MIFLTGGTGFLGRELLARLLLLYPNEKIGVLVRKSADSDSHVRVREILQTIIDPMDLSDAAERVEVIEGDISEFNFGLGDGEFDALAKRCTAIFHSAATTTLNQDRVTAERINVSGTAHVVALASRAHELGNERLFLNHISTAYVAGNSSAIVTPDNLDLNVPFRNAYERSKAEAETLVRAISDKMPTCVFRPSIIVGDSKTGRTSAFNVIYIPARLLVQGVFLKFPALPNIPFDIVPVDYAADAIVTLSALHRHLGEKSGRCYHICAGVNRESTPWEILELLISTVNKYRKRGGLLSMPSLVPPEVLSVAHHSFSAGVKILERMVTARLNVFRQTLPFIPYMMNNPRFDISDTVKDLALARSMHGALMSNSQFNMEKNLSSSRLILPSDENILSQPPLFSSYAERVFKFCIDTNWGKNPLPSHLTA